MADGSFPNVQQVDAEQIAQALSVTKRAVQLRAKREAWEYTEEAGRGGKRRLYPLASLPAPVQAALILRDAKTEIAPRADNTAADLEASLSAAWAIYNMATEKNKARARSAVEALLEVEALHATGMPLMDARKQVAARMQREGIMGGSVQSLCRWAGDVKGVDRKDWLAVLCPGYKGRTAIAHIPEQAWDWYKGHYLTRARPSHADTYRRLQEMAANQGWEIPSSRTFLRRFKDEVPRTTVVIKRDGPEAARKLLPRQMRDALVFGAGEAVNGDGMKFDRLWVAFDDGEILNTATAWFWQDIRTRRVLAWRLGKTESTDLFRLATYDLTAICAPTHYWMDNTRVAANKAMTAGAAGRHRFKSDPEDGLGLLLMIGGEPHFTSVDEDTRNPGAKPIERAFGIGGIHELVATNPRIVAAGGYSKATAIPEALLREVIGEEVARFNSKKNRKTQACNGLLSFDDAWEAGLAERPPRVLAESQRHLLLMAREVVKTASDSGRIVIAAGRRGIARNMYWSEHMPQLAGRKVAVHYDPDNLHAGVHVYGLDGRYLCFADYVPGAAFNSTDAARETQKFQKRIAKANKAIAENETRMTAVERAALYEAAKPTSPDPADTTAPATNVVQGVFQQHPKPERDAMRATGTDGIDPDVEQANKVTNILIQAELRRRIDAMGWRPPEEEQ